MKYLTKIGNSVIQLLISLRLLDQDTKTLSLTAILLMVSIAKLAIFPADAYSVAVLTLAISHANLKKFSAHKKTLEENRNKDASEATNEKINDLSNKLHNIAVTTNLNKLNNR